MNQSSGLQVYEPFNQTLREMCKTPTVFLLTMS